ncbi:MAG: hypothetical protein HRU16_05700 [Planctomycetes bacterium]|nr:hypothetical protein [Planctomycetota bacterium]
MVSRSRKFSALGLLLVLFLLAGCSEPVAPPPVVTKPEMTKEEIARKMQEIRLQKYKERYDALSNAIRTHPDRFEEWIEHLESLIYAAEGTAYAVKAQKLLDEQIQVREESGKKHFDEIAGRVESLIGEGDPLAAERVLEEWDPDGTFEVTASHQSWLQLCEQVAMRQRAEVDYDRITRRARAYRRQEELASAIGLLESYSNEFKGTKEYEEVRTTIADYLAEYEAARSAQAAEQAIEWIDLTIDAYLSSFRASASDPDAEVWTEEDGEVVGTNSSSGAAQLEVGDDAWEEYVVEMEIQLVSGDAVNLGITAGMRPGSAVKNYDVHSFDAEEEEWVRLRVQLREGLVSITDLDSLDALDDDTRPYFPMGGVAILLRPDESVRVRNIRYKVFLPAETEESVEGGTEDESEG